MKNAKFAAFASGIVALGLSAFTLLQTNSIKGTVTPADKAVKAWAISSTDTLSAPVTNGTFEIQNVKAISIIGTFHSCVGEIYPEHFKHIGNTTFIGLLIYVL